MENIIKRRIIFPWKHKNRRNVNNLLLHILSSLLITLQVFDFFRMLFLDWNVSNRMACLALSCLGLSWAELSWAKLSWWENAFGPARFIPKFIFATAFPSNICPVVWAVHLFSSVFINELFTSQQQPFGCFIFGVLCVCHNSKKNNKN